MRILPALPLIALLAAAPSAPAPSPELLAAIKAPSRTPANAARDIYRHPAQTLAFFGVKPDQTVVEIWPGGGWYTEILAPYVAKSGHYIAAAPSEQSRAGVKKLIAANPAAYGKIDFATFPSTTAADRIPDGSVDMVLTFRNVHNWRFFQNDVTQAVFDQMFAMLKPGGVLGLVEHHLPEDAKGITEAESGYMKRSSVIAFATKAGFKLVGESTVNANSKDDHNHQMGVWTLPPVYRLGDTDRAKYAAIGESDRMTLKFVKPAR